MNNNNNDEISRIIKKYVDILLELFSAEDSMELELLREYTTETHLVPSNFFNNTSSCDNQGDVLFADFGNTIILFNDLKSSTKLISALENRNELCIYSLYMYYSSKMLSEILDLLGGKLVECTGDGHYSIFLKNQIDINSIRDHSERFYETFYVNPSIPFINDEEYRKYFLEVIKNFDLLDIAIPFRRYHPYRRYSVALDVDIRWLFLHIFAVFNIRINSTTIMGNRRHKFYTRVGCDEGECKIMRINNGHILQDKLIGKVVHNAAHQANEK